MNKIKVLSEFLANQIAAGEVVQGPESVVKELVENSLDAGAEKISVALQKAGKTLIHVWDDGCGMSKEDLLIAPLRHTTSKLFTIEQLNDIHTFGFRGEALAAISSVSLLEIQTRTKEDEYGWRLIAEPQKEFVLEPINIEVGTQIFVKNLFFNVPARRKFLKTDITELNRVSDTLKRLAISYPNKSFSFFDNNKTMFEVVPTNLENRIIQIVGNKLEGSKLLKVDKMFDKIHIYGYIGQPQFAKTSATTQYFFLNHRSILSRNLTFAVSLAYEQFIARNLKPFFVLNIDIDYSAVDVNVHPQKNEVKFDDERYVFDCIKNAVSDALRLKNFISLQDNIINNDDANIVEHKELNADTGIVENTILVDTKTGEIIENDATDFETNKLTNLSPDTIKHNFNKEFNFDANIADKFNKTSKTKFNDSSYYNNYKGREKGLYLSVREQNKINEIAKKIYDEGQNYNDVNNENSLKNNDLENNYYISINEFKNISIDDISDLSIWQFHNKYIFLQTKTGLLVIDQHNANERFKYEKIMDGIKRQVKMQQNLLFPVELSLTTLQVKTIEELKTELYSIGFDFTIDGNNKLKILAIPEEMNIYDIETNFMNIVDDYIYNNTVNYKSKYEKIVATIACKSAVKAGEKLSIDDMKKIVVNLFSCNMPHICPHGRPIIIDYPLTDFDKKIGRL